MPIAIMMIMTFYGYKNQGVILLLVKTEKQFVCLLFAGEKSKPPMRIELMTSCLLDRRSNH